MRILRKVPGAAVVGAVAVLLVAAPAAAHECFVASRSAQGDASVAAHSAAWGEVALDTILTQFIGVPQSVADCVEANAGEYGIPSSFVFGDKQAVGQDQVIAERNPNMSAKGLSSNGKGIDHAQDAYGPAIGGAIEACSV